MKRPGFYFCICPDWELIKDFIEEIIKEYGFSGGKKIFWGNEGIDEEFWELFLQRSLFKSSHLLILRHAEALPKEFWDRLEKVLSRFYPKIWPFFCFESTWTKGRPNLPLTLKNKKYWKLANERKWIWENSGITVSNVLNYFINLSKKEGVIFSYRDIFPFREVLPLNGAGLKNEVKKIKMLLKAEGRLKPTQEDLLNIISSSGFDVFSAIKVIIENTSKDELWKDIISNKTEDILFLLLSLIFKEAKTLWSIKTGNISYLNLPDFALKKRKEIANKISLEGICRILSLILDIEYAVKTGMVSPSQALDFIVADSSIIFDESKA